MKLNYLTLINFDKMWCGNNQIPASLLRHVSDNKTPSVTLALLRFSISLFLLAELFGYFMITLGLNSSRTIWIFFSGVILKIGGEVASAFFQNRSGIFLSIELQKYLKSLSTHAVEIRSFLTDRGCTETEINSLSSLPREVYQSELNSYQRTRIINIGAPLFCGFALFVNGDTITSFIVVLLGLLSFPIGEKFFKENTFRRESELRIGLSTQLVPYLEKIYQQHIWLTTKVNFLSQLPLLLFSLRFIWNGTGQLLSSFYGLTQGLIGLTGSLAFQKARATSIKTTETATHLLNALSSPYLIVTPQRWKEHCDKKQHHITETPQYSSGVLLDNFSPVVPFEEKDVVTISSFIPYGSICILRAPSGKGKTTFLAALTHLIEHEGEIIFLSQDRSMNVHELSRKEFEKKIFFFREENVEQSARLIDLFKSSTLPSNTAFLEHSKKQFDPMLIDLAWKASDNLIEQEIKNIEQHKPSVFPEIMVDFLNDLRKKQITQIQDILKQAKGNLTTNRIHPERNFATLSSGEKRRLTALIALEYCRVSPDTRFVILDEPLTHLDKENINFQLQTIQQMQETSSPSILIISHHYINEMKEQLRHVSELNLG